MGKGDSSAPMEVYGLAEVWENLASVRGQARDHGYLLKATDPKACMCAANRLNAVANAQILLPCLHRMVESGPKLLLPYLDPLQSELVVFYERLKLPSTDKIVYRTAVELKKLLSFVKRRANKKDEGVTKVSKLSIVALFIYILYDRTFELECTDLL